MFLVIVMPLQPPLPQPEPTPAPQTAPETSAERRERQAAELRRLSDLNMEAAEIAAQQIRAREPVSREFPSPTLALARATRSVTQIITIENRLLDGEPSARPAPHRARQNVSQSPTGRSPAAADPRRLLLRKTLHNATETEPERATRNQLRRMIDERIEEELEADPNLEISLGELLFTIADELGLPIDPAKLSDEVLGLKPPPRPPTDPLGTRSALWAPPYIPDDPDP